MHSTPNLFQKCIQFHGHRCPGLVIGYRATRLAMEKLNARQSEDEELVAVVENDSCAVDAVQMLTGCTLGKGNLIFLDYGKQALTLGDRSNGKAVRVALRSDALPSNSEHHELFEKMRTESASPAEKERFQALHHDRTQKVLDMDDASLFTIEYTPFQFPEKARITRSEPCARCGEPAMITRLEDSPHGLICRACRERGRKTSTTEDELQTFILHPVGRIRTPFKSLDNCPHQGRPAGAEGVIELVADVLPALKDVGKCSHLILLSYHHLADRKKLQTKTPHGPEIRGTFATRSPNRPNPIALNVVELLGIEENRLRVRGVDCLDGTPLLDIKPYSAKLDSFTEAAIGWGQTL